MQRSAHAAMAKTGNGKAPGHAPFLRISPTRRSSACDEEVGVQLMLRIAHLLLHLRNHHLTLFRCPAENPREQAHGVRVDAVADVLALECAHLLITPPFCPRSDRYLFSLVSVLSAYSARGGRSRTSTIRSSTSTSPGYSIRVLSFLAISSFLLNVELQCCSPR